MSKMESPDALIGLELEMPPAPWHHEHDAKFTRIESLFVIPVGVFAELISTARARPARLAAPSPRGGSGRRAAFGPNALPSAERAAQARSRHRRADKNAA
jgi:hypothetical protein